MTSKSPRVLLIDDDPDIARLLEFHFGELGMCIESREDGESGLSRALEGEFDLLIVDLMLPLLDGFEICKQLRNNKVTTPVLMLTSRSEEIDKVLGLEFGADDYLTKPFGIRELLARAKALLRRANTQDKNSLESKKDTLVIAGLKIVFSRRSVWVNDQAIDLTAKEYDLLCLLASSPGRVFTRAQLLDLVWGYESANYDHTVTSHVNRVRSKIEQDPEDPRFILTVWGVGYKFFEDRT